MFEGIKSIKIPLIRPNFPVSIAEKLRVPDPGLWEQVSNACDQALSSDLDDKKRQRIEEIKSFACKFTS